MSERKKEERTKKMEKEKRLPEGYKETKLGLIPNKWNIREFGDFAYRRKDRKNPQNSENVPCVELEHIISESGNINGFVSSSFQKSTKSIFEEGDVLFSKMRPYLRKYWLASFGGVCSSEIWVLRSNVDLAINEFIFYLIQSQKFINVSNRTSGTKMPRADWNLVSKFPFLLPPLPEQKAIADCLGTWDKGIGLLTELIAQKELRKKGLMQQLLTGKKRLKGFSGEWEEKKLGEITTRVTKKNSELNDNVVTISAQRGFVRQEDFFNKRVASDTLSNYYLVEKGDFAYNKSYSNGYPMGAFKRLEDFDKAVVTTLYICFSVRDNTNSNFLKFYFDGGMLIQGLMRIAQEGGRAHGLLNVGLSDFFSLKLTLPPLAEQTAIAQVLQSADRELSLLQAKLAQLQAQKKGLMQQLLLGKKRLAVAVET